MSRAVPQLDDRMALAVASIERQMRVRGLGPLTEVEHAALRSRWEWQGFLLLTESLCQLDLSEARQLLAEWHTWRHGD